MRKYKTTPVLNKLGSTQFNAVPDKSRSQCSRSCLQSVIDGFKKMQQDFCISQH